MKKLIGLCPFAVVVALFLLGQVNISSCTKTKTTTDTLPGVDLSNGLLAYYPFNGNTTDSSGNNNVATVFGNLQYTTDVNNKANSAVLFDGSTNYIVIGDNGKLSPPSISISFNFYENSTEHQNLVSKIDIGSNALSPVWSSVSNGGGGLSPNSAGFVALGPDIPCGSEDPIADDQLVYTGGAISTGQWYQIVCTFDQGTERIYQNGVLKGAQTFSYKTLKQCTDAQIVIGAWYEEGYLFNGKMDELRIYNRALNDREIQTLAKGF